MEVAQHGYIPPAHIGLCIWLVGVHAGGSCWVHNGFALGPRGSVKQDASIRSHVQCELVCGLLKYRPYCIKNNHTKSNREVGGGSSECQHLRVVSSFWGKKGAVNFKLKQCTRSTF